MKLLVGLGNPGEQYARNRHNVGFMAVQLIAREHGLPAFRRRFQGVASEGMIAGEKCLLLLPTTYMNDSGRSVGEAARFLKISTADIVVFHDEIDLAPGKLKVKAGGGVAGHNGLRSITNHLDNDYVRVRIGVGHPGSKEAVAGYVLHDFAKAEFAWLDPMLEAMAKAAPRLVAGEGDKFMSEVALALQPPKPERPKKEPKPAAPAETEAAPEVKPIGPMAAALKSLLGRK